jgi:hypothetical protein
MPIDISLVSSNVVITQANGNKKGYKPSVVSYEFDQNENLLLSIDGKSMVIGLDELTVGEAAPADVDAAITALAAVFLNAGGSASTTFSALSGTEWDGSNKYVTLTGNTALILAPGTRVSGILHVYQDGTGSRTLSINGVSLTINTAADSVTGIGYYVANGTINFTVDLNLVSYTPDLTAPTVLARTAVDANTIEVEFNESVSGTVAGHTFTQNGVEIIPDSVSGTTVRSFVFSETLVDTDVITHSYDSTTGDTEDAAGNELANFSGQAVTNNVAAGMDADALAYITAEETAASITIPSGDQDAISYLFADLKAASLFTKCKILYPFYGTGTLNAIDPQDLDASHRLEHGGTAATIGTEGAVFGGAAYYNMNYNPFAVNGNKNECYVWYVKDPTNGDGVVFGGSDGTGLHLAKNTNPSAANGDITIAQAGLGVNGQNLGTGLFVAGVRTSGGTSFWRALKNGTQIAASSTTINSSPNVSLNLGAYNNNGTMGVLKLNGTMGIFAGFEGLSDAEQNTLSTIFQTFITATGRG